MSMYRFMHRHSRFMLAKKILVYFEILMWTIEFNQARNEPVVNGMQISHKHRRRLRGRRRRRRKNDILIVWITCLFPSYPFPFWSVSYLLQEKFNFRLYFLLYCCYFIVNNLHFNWDNFYFCSTPFQQISNIRRHFFPRS